MQNLALVVKGKQAEVVAKAKGRAAGQAAKDKDKDKAEELKKSITGTHLTHKPLKDPGLVDQSGAPPRDANPSIKDLENPEIRAKASDFLKIWRNQL